MRSMVAEILRWFGVIAVTSVALGCLVWIVSLTFPERDAYGIIVDFGKSLLGVPIQDPWRKWVYDYQSLIGGLLAIVAASATVAQMMRSEAENNKRHRQLIDLQLRPDRLRIERMLVPQRGNLWSVYIDLLALKEPTGDFEEVSTFVEHLKKLNSIMSNQVYSDAWKASSDLFDGNLNHMRTELQQKLASFQGKLTSASSACFYERHMLLPPHQRRQTMVQEPNKKWREWVPEITADAFEIRERLNSLFAELDALAKLYGLHEPKSFV